MTLAVYQIFENAPPKAIAPLDDDIIYIGRAPPPGGITIESRSVSREHAVFMRISHLWFFKDLGSSNGSWLNGQPVNAGIPFLIRKGDTIQLADCVVRLLGDVEETPNFASVIAFSRGEFIDIYPIPEVGKVVSIGGPHTDLKLDVDVGNLPVVVLEKRSDFVCAFPVAQDEKAMINDRPISQLVVLKDRDRITVSPYLLIMNLPSSTNSFADAMSSAKNSELRETFAGWDETPKPIAKIPFGKFSSQSDADDESDRTIVSDTRLGERIAKELEPIPDHAGALEEKIVFILGATMIVAILSLIIWWVIH